MVKVVKLIKCNLYYNYFSVFKKDKNAIHLIGRRSDCDIVINDTGFSREQSMIYFDEKSECWYIKDGGKEKLSGSGTWYI